ncbi:unnamed protein product [Thlaspi arvense]|nr:unnamed protein product [Thlaspi arvense]
MILRFFLRLPSSISSITQQNIRSAPPVGFSRFLGFARSPSKEIFYFFPLASKGVVGSCSCLIMTSSTTGDRRWGTTRRSGMTILGKVAVPKPINLPSQRLENQGLDPNVEIVPKGTLSWGSKSSLNAWGTSSLSPRTESGPGSPSHLSNRPSSGGSVTRPSTADSDKGHDSSSIASNSRPSSASGVFPSNQASVALQRPHSADTRPGSSQLSRFAEAVSETSATWGQHGVAPTKTDGFSLTSGDFPSLGAETASSEKSTMPQVDTLDMALRNYDSADAGPRARPASSSGRSVEDRGVDSAEEANVRIGDANAWRRDNQSYNEDAPRHCREEGKFDSRGSQSYPNASFPHQYDAYRGPPVNNHQGGGWYRENHPYGAPMGPGSFHMDPFPFYPTHVPPVPGHGAGPRGNHPTDGKMFRPPMLDSYVHPRMQTGPGFYPGPVPHEGYYGPPMGYGSPSHRELPFAGRPAGPHAYNKHSGQGGYDTSGNSVALEQNEPSHSQETQRPYRVLLKPQDGRFGKDEAKREEFPANRLPNTEKIAQQMQTSKNRRENSNEASGDVQPIKAEYAAPEDPSLIKKIEGLNAKIRTNDGWQNASSVVNRDQQESKTRTVNSGNSVNSVSARMPRTGHASDTKNSLHYKQGDPATNRNTELAAISGTAISRRSTQQTQGRADYQTNQRVNSEGNDGWRKTIVMAGSSPATVAANSESFAEVNVGDSLDTDSMGKPGSGISVDPNDNQRTTMRELARQRAQQRQKEEEERARDQRAKALAKLEELNRRSQVAGEGSVKNLEGASNASIPDIPEDTRSLSPALLASNSDDVRVRSSVEKKITVAAAKSIESTGESGKTSMQDAMNSNEYANNVGPTQQDNLPRDRDGAASKQKHLGYRQKQNIAFEKKMAGNSFSVATTEVFDVVPSPEVSNAGVLSHNSDMPATSSVSTESTFPKRKNNRNGKKKHKVEETTTMNTTRVAVGKETKSGDESIEIGRARVAETELGSVSGPSLDNKVSGNSSEQISSLADGESQSRAKNNWKPQHLRRTQRNSVPIVKEMAEQTVSKNPIPAVPEKVENVLQKENCGGEGTGILQPSASTAGKFGSPSKSRHGNGRQGKHGRDHGSWHQRGSAASTKALEEGQFVTSNQPIRGTVNYQTSNQTEKIAVAASKDQTTFNADGWNDGWYMTPETHYSAVEESAPGAVVAGKDQGMGIHGKQHASRSNKDGGSNYGDPKKANKRDSSKAHMQQSGHGLGQPDLPVASKESRVPGDHVSHTAVAANVNRAGKYGGRENTRDKAYVSQKRDVAGYEHRGFTSDQKMASADTPAQSQNRSTSKEVQVEQNPNSMFQKNTGQSRRVGRGQESQGGWGTSVQENVHHQHQRPASNRDRQKQNVHYEYKPVGSHANDVREQVKDSSQTEGPRYRETGQGQQRHGGQKLYQQQRGGGAGRNTVRAATQRLIAFGDMSIEEAISYGTAYYLSRDSQLGFLRFPFSLLLSPRAMDSTTALVVKVSHGGVLRRFRVPVKANGQLDLDMAGLRGKIAALFNLSVDADFSLTYSDEDGDVVALVDDNDLFDVTNQRLKFLKINVQSNTGMPTSPVAPESGGSSTATGTPNSQNPVSKIQKGINDVLMAVPNPMRDTISKVYIDLTSKAACSSPVVGELLDCVSKLGQFAIPQESGPSSSGPSLSREVPSAGEKKDASERTQTGKKPANLNEPADPKTSGHVPTSWAPGASFNECPFSGSTVNDSSPNPANLSKHARRACHLKKSSNGDYWTSLGVFHKGIRCDGCGVVPITGPRFKSKVKEDYDLCNICFSVMGNETEYTRMDKPVSFQHIHPFRGQLTPFSNPWLSHPVPRPPHGGLHFRCTRPKLDSRFVLDVNVLDGTVVAPSAPFTKIWKMRNNGSLVWRRGTQIVWIGGDRFSNSLSVDLQIPAEGVTINSELDVKVDFVAPELPGRYISYWRMASSSGAKFGQRVWVLIHVDASLKGSVVNEYHGLNLNAFPDEHLSREFTGINVNHEPAQAGSSSVNPITVEGADVEGEADESQIPEKDDLLVGEVDPAIPRTHSPSSSSSSYNIIDLPNMPTAEALSGGGSSSPTTKDIPVPRQEDIEKNEVELTMLKELEEMGFKEIDLNKEILRDNEYNLEQSVDALCGVSEWDPILEELQEMGFCDDVTNKRLLKKNNGSIKGVVMDLLTGEKEA